MNLENVKVYDFIVSCSSLVAFYLPYLSEKISFLGRFSKMETRSKDIQNYNRHRLRMTYLVPDYQLGKNIKTLFPGGRSPHHSSTNLVKLLFADVLVV